MQQFIRNFTTLSLKTCLGIGLATALSLSTLPAYASGGGGGGGGNEGGGMSSGVNTPQLTRWLSTIRVAHTLRRKNIKKQPRLLAKF